MLEKLNKYLYIYYAIMIIIHYGAFSHIEWINHPGQSLFFSTVFLPIIDIIIITKFLFNSSAYLWSFII